MGKKIRRSGVKKEVSMPKKTLKKPAKKKRKIRFVLVFSGTYMVFGPFSESGAVSYLMARKFVHSKGDVWTNPDNGMQVFLKQVKRPPSVQHEDHPITLFTANDR